MQHLESLRLAALDHEPATSQELAHLATCAECRTERDAYAALSGMAFSERQLSSRADATPLTQWSSLSAQLRKEGLLRTTGEHAIDGVAQGPVVVRSLHGTSISGSYTAPVVNTQHAVVHGTRTSAPWLRAAAAVMLVLGGALMGRLSNGDPVAALSRAASDNSATLGTPGLLAGNSAFPSVEEATRVLTTAQRDYERASLWLASNDTTVRAPEVYRARLAALDQMMAASRAALRDAPQDPVLNHYYMAAYTAREATLQQLVGTLPVDKTIEGY